MAPPSAALAFTHLKSPPYRDAPGKKVRLKEYDVGSAVTRELEEPGKGGVITGSDYNDATSTQWPIAGTVDAKTHRAAWTLAVGGDRRRVPVRGARYRTCILVTHKG